MVLETYGTTGRGADLMPLAAHVANNNLPGGTFKLDTVAVSSPHPAAIVTVPASRVETRFKP